MSLLLRLLQGWISQNPWAWLVAAVVLVGLHLSVQAWHRAQRLPPGPWGLPVVGYLPWLNPTAPQLTLSALAKRYGRVYSIQLGGVPCVVLADAQIMKDVFNRPEANGRAPLYLTHGIMKGYGLIGASGALWREHRKFLVQFMRASGMKGSSTRDALEEKLHTQARELVEKISGHTGALDIHHDLFHIIGNGTNNVVFGITYKDEDPVWVWLRHLLAMGIKAVAITGPVNFLPWTRFLPKFRRTLNYIVENQIKTHAEYHKIIAAHEKFAGYEHKDEREDDHVNSNSEEAKHADINVVKTDEHVKGNYENGLVTESPIDYETELKKNKPEGPGPHSILEAYVQERASRGDDVGLFTYKQLYHFAADIFGAGSDTQLTTLDWHFLNMALYPEIQSKVREELLNVADGRDYITYEESVYMHYTMATLMETQRFRTTVMGIPHGVEKDMIIDGYEVPAGTMLMPLITHVHNNPEVWGDPEVYRPDRFLNVDDGTILRHPSFMPFQTGRRMCPGDDYARMLIFIYNSHILLNYDLKLPEDRPEKHPAEDPVCGVTISPRPYKLVFTKINR